MDDTAGPIFFGLHSYEVGLIVFAQQAGRCPNITWAEGCLKVTENGTAGCKSRIAREPELDRPRRSSRTFCSPVQTTKARHQRRKLLIKDKLETRIWIEVGRSFDNNLIGNQQSSVIGEGNQRSNTLNKDLDLCTDVPTSSRRSNPNLFIWRNP